MSAFDDVARRYLDCRVVNQREIDWLVGQSVPPAAIADPDALAAAEVMFTDKMFMFSDEVAAAHGTTPAVILLLRDETDG